jgi:hypothetical protein
MIKRPIVALTLGRVSRIDANNAMFGANQINALGLRAIAGFSDKSNLCRPGINGDWVISAALIGTAELYS